VAPYAVIVTLMPRSLALVSVRTVRRDHPDDDGQKEHNDPSHELGLIGACRLTNGSRSPRVVRQPELTLLVSVADSVTSATADGAAHRATDPDHNTASVTPLYCAVTLPGRILPAGSPLPLPFRRPLGRGTVSRTSPGHRGGSCVIMNRRDHRRRS